MEVKGEKGESASRGGARVWDSEALKAEILRLRGQGLSTREIGRRLGISHNLVVYYLKKMS
jgi:DNA-binding NarL/FixJ family response regulator